MQERTELELLKQQLESVTRERDANRRIIEQMRYKQLVQDDGNFIFKDKCSGVRLVDRGENDRHQSVQILVEDDMNWFVAHSLSSYWLPELISVLRVALHELNHSEDFSREDNGYGWRRN